MEIQSALNSGLYGFQRASDRVAEATLDINRQTTVRPAEDTRPEARPAPTVEQSLVQLTQAQLHAEANVKTLRSADEMLGTVIDIRV